MTGDKPDGAMNRRRFLSLAGGGLAALVMGLSSCRTLQVMRTESAIQKKVETYKPAFSEEDYSALEQGVAKKLRSMYFDREYIPGTSDEHRDLFKVLRYPGEDMTLFAENIEAVLSEIDAYQLLPREAREGKNLDLQSRATIDIDAILPRKADVATENKDKLSEETIEGFENDKCPTAGAYDPDYPELVFYREGDYMRYHVAAHETAHGAVDREELANYLALRGAMKANEAISPGVHETNWLFSEFYYLYRSVSKWRHTQAPSACSDRKKTKWKDYYQKYVDLVLSNQDMRDYFYVDKVLAGEDISLLD